MWASIVIRLCALSASLSLLVACASPETTETLARAYPETTTMGLLQLEGSMTIAVPSDAAPLGFVGRGGEPRGMTVELGRYVARTLDVTPEFISMPADEVVTAVDDAEADIAFTIAPLSEEAVRVAEHSFTSPYLIAHQRLLVHAGDAADEVEDLAGHSVCSFLDPSTGIDLSSINDDVEIVNATSIRECVSSLRTRETQVATASDTRLAGMMRALNRHAAGPRWTITGDQLTTEGYAAAVISGSPAWLNFVNSALARAEDEGVWGAAYERFVEPYLGPQDPPEISTEGAAALYPNLDEQV